MTDQHFDLSALADAAKSCTCTAHLHFNDQGDTVFSIGNENIGAAEFDRFDEAMTWATDRAESAAGDCVEESGAALASECLNDMMDVDSQALRIRLLQVAILDLQRLPHPKRAAGGFSLYLAPFIEIGLANLPEAEE